MNWHFLKVSPQVKIPQSSAWYAADSPRNEERAWSKRFCLQMSLIFYVRWFNLPKVFLHASNWVRCLFLDQSPTKRNGVAILKWANDNLFLGKGKPSWNSRNCHSLLENDIRILLAREERWLMDRQTVSVVTLYVSFSIFEVKPFWVYEECLWILHIITTIIICHS